MKHTKVLLASAVCSLGLSLQPLSAQTFDRLTDSLSYKAELQFTTGSGTTPLWLNANKYGLSSLEQTNGYLRAGVERPLSVDNDRKWGIGYGVDVAVASHFTSNFVVQQAYVEGRWLKGVLTLGSKEQPMELKNNALSSGSQTLGINSRPVPEARIALGDWWKVFGLNWLRLKGHIAFGMMTDNGWQHEFTAGRNTYRDNRLFHSKAGYLMFGNPDAFQPLSVIAGVEMATIFGGDRYDYRSGEKVLVQKGKVNLRSFWNALVAGGPDIGEVLYTNVAGDVLGSWVARVNYDTDNWRLGVYADKFFEDHSSMFQLDYDGYGTGEEWNTKKKSRFILYDFKDWMLGAELNFKNGTWVRDVVVEYLYTKYQSGPIYHDRTKDISDHIGGSDNYYNHGNYLGWEHWGQTIGNPLFKSPIYNKDGRIYFTNNRFTAYHLGISGEPMPRLNYRLLLSYQDGLGTYTEPYLNVKHNLSAMLEAGYRFNHQWTVIAAGAMDRGSILGNNYGLQLTLRKTGLFKHAK